MGKPNKNKNAQNEPNPKTQIQEPEFEVKTDAPVLSAGEKKLRAQQERLRKEEEEAEKLKKEKEAEKKKKNNKTSSNKSKTKQAAPKSKEEDKPEAKPKNKEDEDNPEAKFKNIRIENDATDSSEQETRKPKNSQNEFEKEYTSWDQEFTSTSGDADDAWSNNWRNKDKREIAKPNYSNNKQSANNSFGKNYYSSFSDGKNDEEFNMFVNNRKNFNGKVREVKGDLFNAPNDYSLAHCVAEDFSMGAGIAKEFKAKFKRVSKLLDQNAGTGGLAILEDKDRFIYYLVTKRYSRGKPTLYTLWKSLLKLRDHMAENKVTKLAIPQIGCGLDRLDWPQVKRMLEYIFSKNEVDIVVYILDLNADESPNQSRVPRKCYTKHVVLPLTDIQSETGLIFFGTEDGAVTHEMECLAQKFDFVNKYKTMKKSIGDVVKIIDRNEYLYGLIVKRTIKNKIIFADFEKCLYDLRKMLKTDKTVYIGLQGFVDKDDEAITEKLVNLMQYILQDVEIWVCWPKELAHYCPQQKY